MLKKDSIAKVQKGKTITKCVIIVSLICQYRCINGPLWVHRDRWDHFLGCGLLCL